MSSAVEEGWSSKKDDPRRTRCRIEKAEHLIRNGVVRVRDIAMCMGLDYHVTWHLLMNAGLDEEMRRELELEHRT